MKISFVIPCYRSSKTITLVVDEIKAAMARRPGADYEVVMVSDHSPDNVYAVISELCRNDQARLHGIELARNFGQHAALLAGYARTSGDYVVSLDDDGQTPVSEVWSLVDRLQDGGLDVVYASYPEKKHSLLRNWGSWVNDRMACWLLDKPLLDTVRRRLLGRQVIEDKNAELTEGQDSPFTSLLQKCRWRDLVLTLSHVFACPPNCAKSAGIKSRGGQTIHRAFRIRILS